MTIEVIDPVVTETIKNKCKRGKERVEDETVTVTVTVYDEYLPGISDIYYRKSLIPNQKIRQFFYPIP